MHSGTKEQQGHITGHLCSGSCLLASIVNVQIQFLDGNPPSHLHPLMESVKFNFIPEF